MTLEDLLRAEYLDSNGKPYWPDFTISIQVMRNYGAGGVRVIVRPSDCDGETLDFSIYGNELRPIPTGEALTGEVT